MSLRVISDVEAALRGLTPVWEEDGRVFLSVPIQFPSGSLAVVEVAGGRDIVTVSDRGQGLQEAEMYSAEDAYPKAARAQAAHRGVEFDGHSMFVLRLPKSALAGGIVAVANASVAAAIEAIRADSERKIETKNEEIFQRVRAAFPDAQVTKRVTLAGAHAQWDAHNVVRLGTRTAVFEPVSAHTISIASKFTMFSDLARRPDMVLAALVDNVSQLGDRGQMLYDVARVIPANAPARTLQSVASGNVAG